MIKKLSIFNIAEALSEDFSRAAALALARFLDENCDENERFCFVATSCDWSEYDSALAFFQHYYGDEWKSELGIDEEEEEAELDEDELEELALAHVSEKTYIVVFDGGIIVQAY